MLILLLATTYLPNYLASSRNSKYFMLLINLFTCDYRESVCKVMNSIKIYLILTYLFWLFYKVSF